MANEAETAQIPSANVPLAKSRRILRRHGQGTMAPVGSCEPRRTRRGGPTFLLSFLLAWLLGFLFHDSASKRSGQFLFCLPVLVDLWEFLTDSSLLI